MKKDTPKKSPHRNPYARKVEKEVEGIRDSLSLAPDTIGLIAAGYEAAQKTHDGGKLFSKAILKRDIAKIRFDIWMANQRTKVRAILLEDREQRLKTYLLSPATKRGFKPTEPKEKEIDDFIKTTSAYRKWREELADLEYAVNMAEKAYFKPLEQRCNLIMNLNKIVYRESPE